MPGYRTWATGDVPSAADFNNLHADPQSADVATGQSTTSTSYVDLTTAGPAVTETLVTGQKVLVTVSCRADNSAGTSTSASNMSFAVSGASTLAAADANAAEITGICGAGTTTRVSLFTAQATGSTVFTAKYRVINTGTSTWWDRRITTKKF